MNLSEMLDRSQIITALKIIKRECEKYERCEGGCPFYNGRVDDMCEIRRVTPVCWEINDSEEWRAFK